MNLTLEQKRLRAIVYDADCIDEPDEKLFNPDFWHARDAVAGEATGRGSALLLDTPMGPAVLRQYRRGGWAAWVSDDRYVFTGFRRSRPYREAYMLAHVVRLGLPVPRPLAALTKRNGLIYRGALLTRRIENAEPLADLLGSLQPHEPVWTEIGRVVGSLHGAGVVHADLNARNILVGADGAVHLVDFDRARISHRARTRFRRNLERLRRSLVKCWPAGEKGDFAASWDDLIAGYRG